MDRRRIRLALAAAATAGSLVSTTLPAAAHQPLTLTTTHARVERSPILVDGTVSFAATARFAKAQESRYFRFVLGDGAMLKADYLILDKLPERKLRTSQLPQVTITTPSGKVVKLAIDERTSFYEPYGGKHYFFLSRIAQPAEPGVHTVRIVSRAKADVIVAVGAKEVRGDVLSVGTAAGTCPVRLTNESDITDARAKQLVGMGEHSATSCAAVNGWLVRVADRDGEPQMLTKDYRTNRVNLTVVQDRVTDVYVG